MNRKIKATDAQPASRPATDTANIGVIVLAAGASIRMGKAKQLLRYEGETLLRRATAAALASRCRPVIVVLGAHANVSALQNEITDTDAQIVINKQWAEGMSSSIRCGIAQLEATTNGQIEGAVLTLCDQPFVTGEVINRLLEAHCAGASSLVASAYEAEGVEARGVPALFGRALFSELTSLRGTIGAKRVIERHLTRATVIAVPEAIFDVDTLRDYQSLLTHTASNPT